MSEQSEAEWDSVPGISAAQRAALEAAGIPTPQALTLASVEQLVSVTGMSRAQAERTLAALSSRQESELEEAPPTDEAMPEPDGALPELTASEPGAPEPEPATELDRALLVLQTALSDATRAFADSATLTRRCTHLALLLDRLAAGPPPSGLKRRAGLTARLRRLTLHLEKAVARGERAKTPGAISQLQIRLKAEQAALQEFASSTPKTTRKNKL